MSDSQKVNLSGEYPVEMSLIQAELQLALDTIEKRLGELDLREYRHHPKARTEVQRARAAVKQAQHELTQVAIEDAEEVS